MKVYVHDNGIILAGKGWEVVQKLKEKTQEFVYVTEWVQKIAAK